jgi:hypothetical protein
MLARFERCETSLTAEAKRFGLVTTDSIRNALTRLVGERKTRQLVKASAAVQGPKHHSETSTARRAARQQAAASSASVESSRPKFRDTVWNVEEGPVTEVHLADMRVLRVQRLNDQVLVCVTRPLSRIMTAARAVGGTVFLPIAAITRVVQALRDAGGVTEDPPAPVVRPNGRRTKGRRRRRS